MALDVTRICDFCGEPGADDLFHALHCDGRQGRVEAAGARGHRPRGTRSTTEAMQLLQARRRALIDAGRIVAEQLIRACGWTHSRLVLETMAARGLLDATVTHDYWLGAVFHDPRFRWTGQWHVHHSPARNIHERTVKIWTLAEWRDDR